MMQCGRCAGGTLCGLAATYIRSTSEHAPATIIYRWFYSWI